MLTCVIFMFQFDCTNTLNDQILENVKVEMDPSDSDFEVVCYIPRPSLPYNTPGTTYTLVKLPEDASSGLYRELSISWCSESYCSLTFVLLCAHC